MSESISTNKKSRRRTIAAAVAAGALIGPVLGAINQNRSCGFNQGESLSCVPFVNFDEKNTTREVVLKVNPSLGGSSIVYNQDMSQTVLETEGDRRPSDAVGMLLSEKSDKVCARFIFYDRKTMVAERMSRAISVKMGIEQTLSAGTNMNATELYEINVDPTGKNDGTIILDYTSVSVGGNNNHLPKVNSGPSLQV